MKDEEQDARDVLTAELAAVIEGHGPEAAAGATPEAAAREWAAAGFDDPAEVAEWLAARCFAPRGARALDDAGVTPEQAAALTREGSAGYEETVGFKVARGDLSVEAARRIATSAFWNT